MQPTIETMEQSFRIGGLAFFRCVLAHELAHALVADGLAWPSGPSPSGCSGARRVVGEAERRLLLEAARATR